MIFYNRSQFVSWFEEETKKYLGKSGTWTSPIEYQKAADLILRKIDPDIEIPNPYEDGPWVSVFRYGEKIWDKNRVKLKDKDIPLSTSTTDSPSSNTTSSSSPESGIIRRHNFESALRKIQEFADKTPDIPDLEKFKTDGWLFGWGDHYVNGKEMNNYVDKVQKLFLAHNNIIIKTIQEFKDVYSTFDFLDREYLSGILNAVAAASKASEGAKTASNQAKEASDQAKEAAARTLKNEADLKKDVENLRKLVEKIRTIKEDLSAKIEDINGSFSHKLLKIEEDLSTHYISVEQYNQLTAQVSDNSHSKGDLVGAYIVAGLSLLCSICSFLFR